jgi:small subunit ribosomal protein S4
MKLVKKCRYCRREGEKLFLKGKRCYSPKCPIDQKGAVPPGEHGVGRWRRLSEYGRQLREKQKAKRIFGINESQLKKYLDEAKNEGESVGYELIKLLETRLDNIVYRLGLVPSRATAKQLIVHGHVYVNEQKVTIPSYRVELEDEISLSEKAQKMTKIEDWIKGEGKDKTAEWLQRKGFIGKVIKQPERENLVSNIDETLIIEFYSR